MFAECNHTTHYLLIMTMIRTICVLSLATSARGFAFLSAFQQKEAGNPALAQLAKAPVGTLLDLRLDVGNNENSRISLQGLHLELSPEAAVDDLRPLLPGADGPNTGVSSGAKAIVVKDEAFFVGMSGKKNVPLHHGCWEMVWRDNAPAGVIVCGFDLKESVQRNDASLEKGRIYMTFPVWTKEGLQEKQEYRRKVEAQVKLHKDAKKEAYQKIKETNNLIMKALHFRNAAEATENLSYVKTDSVAQIPLDKDVMALGDDIMITTEGTVWTKDEAIFGNIQHTLLGTATIRPGASP